MTLEEGCLGNISKDFQHLEEHQCRVELHLETDICDVSCLLFSRCEESKVRATMDVKKKEMDLLSNSIAAYAHIKGKSHCGTEQ